MREIMMPLHGCTIRQFVTQQRFWLIRKDKSNLKGPFKVYMYCNKGKLKRDKITLGDIVDNDCSVPLNGRVVGYFICEKIVPVKVFDNGSIQDFMFHHLSESDRSYEDIADYIGYGNTGYAWRVSECVMFSEPQSLSKYQGKSCDNQHKVGNECYCEAGLFTRCFFLSANNICTRYTPRCNHWYYIYKEDTK